MRQCPVELLKFVVRIREIVMRIIAFRIDCNHLIGVFDCFVPTMSQMSYEHSASLINAYSLFGFITRAFSKWIIASAYFCFASNFSPIFIFAINCSPNLLVRELPRFNDDWALVDVNRVDSRGDHHDHAAEREGRKRQCQSTQKFCAQRGNSSLVETKVLYLTKNRADIAAMRATKGIGWRNKSRVVFESSWKSTAPIPK